jgi:hypothetical protein
MRILLTEQDGDAGTTSGQDVKHRSFILEAIFAFYSPMSFGICGVLQL